MFRQDNRDKYDIPFAFSEEPKTSQLTPSTPGAWAAHPIHCPLTELPKGATIIDEKKCNVFFVHPTTFRGLGANWNADLDNLEINTITKTWALKHQASVFIGMGRIFAPKYRQAHLRCFYTDTEDSRAALDLAYSDVRSAFIWFLENEDDGAPIILAGHSQGSYHLIRIMQEFFDGKPLFKRLIAAYLPGMSMDVDAFKHIPPLTSPNQTGGYVRWMTVTEGHYPPYYKESMADHFVVNPINFNSVLLDYSDYRQHMGTLTRKFRIRHAKKLIAKPYKGMLWIKPKSNPLGAIIRIKDWHIADYNLFWSNIRTNIKLRINSFEGL